MSVSETYCGAPNCGKPTQAGTLCPDCHHELEELVRGLPWMFEQLLNAVTRQVRFTTNGGAKAAETPLMFNERASMEHASLSATVQLWQSRVADHIGLPVRHPNADAASRWIGAHLYRTHSYIDAGKMLDSFDKALESAANVIHKPHARQFLGDCETTDENQHACPGRIYARSDETEARCDTCGHTSEADALKLKLLNALDDRNLTAAEIAKMSSYMALTINREQVRKLVNSWHARKRIGATGFDGETPRFRFLEVRLMLERGEELRRLA